MKQKKTKHREKSHLKKSASSIHNAEDLEKAELSGSSSSDSSLNASSTDEDESEGLGDGNIGRSDKDIIHK